MAAIGVRELKEQTSRVLRRVRERGEEIESTHHGHVIARLVPASRARPQRRTTAAVWATLDQVAREISARWPKGRSAAEAVKEGRREL
jgi:prevent-host-death family protein